MSEEVYTVEQFAERLKLHPKTVLRFIRDGRLRAVKVGKSYRILRTEMEAMTGRSAVEEFSALHSGLQSMIEVRETRSKSRVTSIVDIPDVAPDAAQRLARMLPAARMGQETHRDLMNIDVVYDPARRHLKVLIVGSPADNAAMLKMIEVLTET
jgi:excisionase family DNA binding protein